jgi:gamma-glutamyl:cysteine ligase YbdK (ATP-grasp superfamily)
VTTPIAAFAACGIELEYMIVGRDSLAVLPIADRLLDELGAPNARAGDGADSPVGWSSELARHVVEIKNAVPARDLAPLPARFRDAIREANRLLARQDAMLMPTAMHPWMDPRRETSLSEGEIYRTYDRIYGCNGHGWANLQSMHVNLPFADDAEFARLHAAIRLVLPLLPALAASSPIADDAPTGLLDARLDAYRRICAITPSVSGKVVPDTVATQSEYDARILQPMYAQIAQHDPGGVLAHEWLNSRGAIARFDRSSIEIRVIDVQECPRADLAIAAATCAVVKALYDERYGPLDEQQAVATDTLHDVLLATIRDADAAVVGDADYLHVLGMPASRRSARDVWSALLADSDAQAWWRPSIDAILQQGPLARRILNAAGTAPGRDRLRAVYRALCQCLDDDRMLQP